MSKAQSHLRIVASNDPASARERLAEAFQSSMTEHLRRHTDGTNVNSKTLLTTDYLNHFNEIIMLLELVPSAPTQFSSELEAWKHETYEEHFEHSGFRDKDLAIACYRNAPQDVRKAFDSSVADLEQEMVLLLKQVQTKIEDGDAEGLSELCNDGIPRLQDLVQVTAGIVNGDVPDEGQNDDSSSADAQSAVDALFD